MAGTRLAVHATFVVEIVILTCVSLYYGSLRPLNLELGRTIRSDVDALFIDRTGLSISNPDSGQNIDDWIEALQQLGSSALPQPEKLSLPKDRHRPLLTTAPACTVMLTALDEDPGSWDGATKQEAKGHHTMLGLALDAIAKEIFQPIAEQLSTITHFMIKTRTAAYGHLSSDAEAKKVQPNSSNEGDEEATPTTSISEYVISSRKAQKFWPEHEAILSMPRRLAPSTMGTTNNCYIDLIIYIPSRNYTPISIQGSKDMSTSEAFQLPGGRGAVAIANIMPNKEGGGSIEEKYAESMLRAFSYLIEYVHKETGLAMTEQDVSVLRKELLPEKYDDTIAKIKSVWDVAQNASRMRVTKETGDKIAHCLQDLQVAVDAAKKGDEITSMARINSSLSLAEELRSNGDMLEQMYFPQDHYLAVFTPLLLPLLMPLLLGLVKETKRYNKLRKSERYDDGTEEEENENNADTSKNDANNR